MAQLDYNYNQGVAFAGMKADSRFDLVESYIAEADIDFGLAVGSEKGDVEGVAGVTKDEATLTFNADFVTSNSIVITVNGNSTPAIAFDTDHDTTMDNVKAAIELLSEVTSVSLTDATNNRQFTIVAAGTVISVSEAVTGGASQPSGTVVLIGDNVFRGIALHTHKEGGKYYTNDAVNVLRQGCAWVVTSVAVTADDDVYVDVVGGESKFTNVSTNNLATGGKFKSTIAAAGIVKAEINLV